MSKKHTVVVIGGGTGGIMVASRILRLRKNIDLAIIEPADTHYYQPAWTLVGANTYSFDKTARPMSSMIPPGAKWYKEFVVSFQPEDNSITLKNGDKIGYDYLIVSPGLRMAPELAEGLTEAMDKGVVCSNYTDPLHTWEVLKNFKGGTALFTQPTTPIKCGGAPQKILYLAESHFRRAGVRDKTKVLFATAGTVIFGVKPIAETLMNVIDRKDINVRFYHQLVGVDGKNQIAWYKLGKEPDGAVITGDGVSVNDLDKAIQYNYKDVKVTVDGDRYGIHFDMLHLAPPQAAPKFVASSPLANADGWLDVDHYTLLHNKYSNIWGIGDAPALPTAKTGAAIRKQVPVVIDQLFAKLDSSNPAGKKYNGYSSCPLVTDYGKMVLAEFDYNNNFTPDPGLKMMLIFDSSKEHWRLWILKKYILPYLYWHKMMKGKEV